MTGKQIQLVDNSAVKTNQALVVGFVILSFLLDSVPLLAFLAAVMVISVLFPTVALFTRLYKHVLKPAGLVRPRVVQDNPAPHRFALGLGASFVGGATLALAAGLPALGWALAWIVAALAALNVIVGFCTGCFIYYQLNRLGVPGFSARAVEHN